MEKLFYILGRCRFLIGLEFAKQAGNAAHHHDRDHMSQLQTNIILMSCKYGRSQITV